MFIELFEPKCQIIIFQIMQNWDSDIPQAVKQKLELLLERRETLLNQQQQVRQRELLERHRKQILKQSNEHQQTVEQLLECEKSNLIDILDQAYHRPSSRQRMPTLEQSTISFQREEHSTLNANHKSSKTNRSASTNVSCFNTHSPQRQYLKQHDDQYEQTIKQLQEALEIKNQEVSALKSLNQQLNTKYDILEKTYQKVQMQTELFKENLIGKLGSYAQKLEQLNENEELLQKMQAENARLKQEKEELIWLLQKKSIR